MAYFPAKEEVFSLGLSQALDSQAIMWVQCRPDGWSTPAPGCGQKPKQRLQQGSPDWTQTASCHVLALTMGNPGNPTGCG